MKLSRISIATLLIAGGAQLAAAESYRGDVNNDGKVDIADLKAMLSHMASTGGMNPEKGYDMNADSRLDDKDIQFLADLIIKKSNLPNEGVNIGIGGWGDDNNDYGGSVGGTRSESSSDNSSSPYVDIISQIYDYSTSVTTMTARLNVPSETAGLLIDLNVPDMLSAEAEDITILAENESAGQLKLYGTPAILCKDGDHHFRFILFSPTLSGFSGELDLLTIKYEAPLPSPSISFSDCQAISPDSGEAYIFSSNIDRDWYYWEVESINISNEEPEGGFVLNHPETLALDVNVEPGSATDRRFSLTSSDENVAKVSDDGTVTSVGKGTAVITAATLDGSDLKTSVTVNVKEASSAVESVESVKDGTFDIYDLNGHIIKKSANPDSLDNLPKGVYIISCKERRFKVIR